MTAVSSVDGSGGVAQQVGKDVTDPAAPAGELALRWPSQFAPHARGKHGQRRRDRVLEQAVRILEPESWQHVQDLHVVLGACTVPPGAMAAVRLLTAPVAHLVAVAVNEAYWHDRQAQPVDLVLRKVTWRGRSILEVSWDDGPTVAALHLQMHDLLWDALHLSWENPLLEQDAAALEARRSMRSIAVLSLAEDQAVATSLLTESQWQRATSEPLQWRFPLGEPEDCDMGMSRRQEGPCVSLRREVSARTAVWSMQLPGVRGLLEEVRKGQGTRRSLGSVLWARQGAPGMERAGWPGESDPWAHRRLPPAEEFWMLIQEDLEAAPTTGDEARELDLALQVCQVSDPWEVGIERYAGQVLEAGRWWLSRRGKWKATCS